MKENDTRPICRDCIYYEPDIRNKPIFYCRLWKTTFGTIDECGKFVLRKDK